MSTIDKNTHFCSSYTPKEAENFYCSSLDMSVFVDGKYVVCKKEGKCRYKKLKSEL